MIPDANWLEGVWVMLRDVSVLLRFFCSISVLELCNVPVNDTVVCSEVSACYDLSIISEIALRPKFYYCVHFFDAAFNTERPEGKKTNKRTNKNKSARVPIKIYGADGAEKTIL